MLPTLAEAERRLGGSWRGSQLERLWRKIDGGAVSLMQAHGVTALRLSVALVFIWFGALKVIDRSPVADLAADTIYWLPADPFVRFLGVWEVAVGVGLLLRAALRLTLFLFWAQLAGTLLVFLFRYDVAFQSGNPLLLTMTGEFVVKNLVLIAAGLVIGSKVRAGSEGATRRG